MTAGRPRLHDEKIPEIIRLINLHWSEREICEKMGVSKGTVNRIKKGMK